MFADVTRNPHLMDLKGAVSSLESWFLERARPLPWRASKDPYRIWISEVMLQQTTVAAVIEHYKKFCQRFPHLESLANAPVEDVLESWSGLGYYSRARNLHKSAKLILQQGAFPKTFSELLSLPGFGPYTSRAVSSLAFGERVGVLDGNVIRVLCRLHGDASEWWKATQIKRLQTLSDQWAILAKDPSVSNQGLMELGATVCTPQKVHCALCPISHHCQSLQKNTVDEIPLKKPRKKLQEFQWTMSVCIHDKKIALIENKQHAPVLKNNLLPPSRWKSVEKAPLKFNFVHTVTHHKIYVKIRYLDPTDSELSECVWIPIKEVKKHSPTSFMQKILTTRPSAE